MEKEFIPYEQAVALKELGFDEYCFGLYGKSEGTLFKVISEKFDDVDDLHFIKAPLWQQVFRWFREKCGFDLTIQHNKKYIAIVYSSVKNFSIDEYDTYEEAELECLKKLIEIVKNK
jgi:hypothetical protein